MTEYQADVIIGLLEKILALLNAVAKDVDKLERKAN